MNRHRSLSVFGALICFYGYNAFLVHTISDFVDYLSELYHDTC